MPSMTSNSNLRDMIDILCSLLPVLSDIVIQYAQLQWQVIDEWKFSESGLPIEIICPENQYTPLPPVLYTTDWDSTSIRTLTLGGTQCTPWTPLVSSHNTQSGFIKMKLRNPSGIAIDHEFLYVIDMNIFYIFHFQTSHLIEKRYLGGGSFSQCRGLKVDKNNVYYTNNDQIICAVKHKKWWFSPINWKTKKGLFSSEINIEIDDQFLYVCDYNRNKISLLNKKNGKLLAVWGKYGQSDGELDGPLGLHVYDKFLYVMDNNRIQLFTPQGLFMQKIAGSSQKEQNSLGQYGDFNQPRGMCRVGDRLYVTDSSNHRILVFAKNQEYAHPENV